MSNLLRNLIVKCTPQCIISNKRFFLDASPSKLERNIGILPMALILRSIGEQWRVVLSFEGLKAKSGIMISRWCMYRLLLHYSRVY